MKDLEYLEYAYRVEANYLCRYRNKIKGFEDWKDKLIEMHKYLTGQEPRIEGDYWMVDDDTGYDLWLMYERGINAPTKIDRAQ